jgi:hypothetical protein
MQARVFALERDNARLWLHICELEQRLDALEARHGGGDQEQDE